MRSKLPAVAYPQAFCNESAFRLDAAELSKCSWRHGRLALRFASPRSKCLRGLFAEPPAAVDLRDAPGALSARLAFRRSFCSLRSLCRRRVLQAVGREPARRF